MVCVVTYHFTSFRRVIHSFIFSKLGNCCIKNIGLIYSCEEKYDENFGCNVKEEEYLGTDYCRNIIRKILTNFPEIQNCVYQEQTQRIANEKYNIELSDATYLVSFTIDTFNDKEETQLEIQIVSSIDNNEYDIFLEKFKVYLKNILLMEWEICTWIIDEQSEYLGMQLYPLIFKAENKIRAFINKVMIRKFGLKWMERIGLEDILKGYNKTNVDFKRKVPEFNDINDCLICSTIESLKKLILESKVYEPSLKLSDVQSLKIQKWLAEKKPNSIFEFLLKERKVKAEIWQDVFEKYFDHKIDKEIEDFIKNRNHVAHNKLMTKASYEKMKNNILEIQTLFDIADSKFIEEDPSDELYETWTVEYEEIKEKKEYIYNRIKDETGINILFSEQIFSLFEYEIKKLYTEIADAEYFSYAVTVSSLNVVENQPNPQILFSVNSNVNETFSFKVYVSIEITDGMGEDSYLKLWIEKQDGTIFLETEVIYHNGKAHEDSIECYYIPDSRSSFDNEILKNFIENLKSYIKNDMNKIKIKADSLVFSSVKDGGASPVANIPCWNCSQYYISVNDVLYPYGKCMNCGEENEIFICEKCGNIYPENEGGEFGGIHLCSYCWEKIENE